MKDVLAVLFTMLLAVTLVACDSNDDGGDTEQATAQVRFVHSSPDAGPVDVFVDDQEVAGDFSYRAPTQTDASPRTSDYLDVPVGVGAVIDVRAAGDGTELYSLNVDGNNGLSENRRYTVIVAGAAAANTEAPQAILLRDNFVDLQSGQIGLRLVHGSALAADLFSNGVDVYVTDAGQSDLSGEQPLVADFTFTQDTGGRLLDTTGAFAPRTLTTGTQQAVYVTAAGSPDPALQVPIGGQGGLPISSQQFVTGIAADIPDGGGSLTVGAQAIIESAPDSNN